MTPGTTQARRGQELAAGRPMATRVLHVITELGYGGAETVVLDLVRHGPSLGWTSAVASAGGARALSLGEAGCAHFVIPVVERSPLRVAPAAAALRRAIHRFVPDVVVAHNVSSSVVATVASMTARPAPHLVSVFHGVTGKDVALAAAMLDRFPGRVVTVSSSARDRLVAQGLQRCDVTVIPNSVDIPALPSKQQARERLGIPTDARVALCLARLVEQKRLDVLLRAWAKVPPGPQLLIAGDGPLRRRLEGRAEELGIAATARFLGPRRDVPCLLAAADLGVLSSEWEGLPMAALESMAAGLPMVATAVDGLTELVGERQGILVPVGDPVALASALTALLFDEPRLRAAGAAARQLVSERHDGATMARSYAGLVAAETAGPRPRATFARTVLGRAT